MNRVLRLGLSLRTRLTLWYGALLALTLLADLLLVSRVSDARLLAGLTALIAAATSFAAAFLREVIRRLFYK